jgi:hypothetical protein
MIAGQMQLVGFFNQHFIKHNDEQKAAYKVQLQHINKIADFLMKLDAAQNERKLLKAKFNVILGYYISAREQMGMMTKQSDKDALVQNLRKQANNL